MINLEEVLETMESVALEAGNMLLTLQPQTKQLATRKDFLTDADLKSEKIILSTLQGCYPGISSLSEEKGGDEKTEGLLWVVDPVDGTLNYFLGDDYWGVSIALVEGGKTIAGIIYFPAKEIICVATKDTGAKWRYSHAGSDWADLKVSTQSNMRESQFWLDWGKEEHDGEDHKKVYSLIEKLDRHSLYPQIRNCCTADMMAVASGKIAGHVFLKPEPFDIAAAGLIVEKAGGSVTDISGKPWSPFSRSLVATNGVVHQKLLSIISSE